MRGLLTRHLKAEFPRYIAEGGSGWGAEYPQFDDRLSGIASGTMIATERGWRAVETLSVGDRALTFDNGLQEIVAVTRGTFFGSDDMAPELCCPVVVPAGALGNEDPLTLLPEETVMIESDAAEAMSGDPFALVPAMALAGFRGIERMASPRPIEIVTLHFANDEVIYAEGGALVLAPAAVPGLVTTDFLSSNGFATPYQIFKGKEARALLAAMALEDARARGAAAYAAAA